ncbi:glucan endo-1 [Forsythia ovata]|uniref:Glucan endo-1 n=1 Tax=Forsythia ovata TaxID=205694 RepID=A0ABD1WNK4_9LAMI
MKFSKIQSLLSVFLFLSTIFVQHFAAVHSIGVNYGTLKNNFPPPAQVAQFFKDKTTIDRIKIFDVNPDILRVFSGTRIFVVVTVPNGEIPNLVNIKYAWRWAGNNIKPFYPQTKINYILVGNKVLHWGPQNLIDNLVSAMRTLHRALIRSGIQGVNVTMAHSLGILEFLPVAEFGQVSSGLGQERSSPHAAIFAGNKISIHGESISIFRILTKTGKFRSLQTKLSSTR